jgi:hypothetical protein
MISETIRNDINVRKAFDELAQFEAVLTQDPRDGNAFCNVVAGRNAVVNVLTCNSHNYKTQPRVSSAFTNLMLADTAFGKGSKTIQDWNTVLEARQAVLEAVADLDKKKRAASADADGDGAGAGPQATGRRKKQRAVWRDDAGAGPAPERQAAAGSTVVVDLSQEPDDE